jgi:hypothetical protein
MQTKTTAHQYSPALPLLDRILDFLLCHKNQSSFAIPTLIRLLKHAESVLCVVSVFSSLISFKDSTFGALQFASSQILGSKLFFLLGILVARSLSFSHYMYLYSLCVFLCLVLSKAHPTASAHFICFSFVGLPNTARQLIKACTKLSRHCSEILISSRP